MGAFGAFGDIVSLKVVRDKGGEFFALVKTPPRGQNAAPLAP
jgi:hypothetical protein